MFPERVRAAAERGDEAAAYQWDHSIFPFMFKSREEEQDSLIGTKQALEKITGGQLPGYMSAGPRSTLHIMELLAELNIRWTCDYVAAEIPYLISVNAKRIVSVGYAVPGFIDADWVGSRPRPDAKPIR